MFKYGTTNGHLVGIVMQELVRRAMREIHKQRLSFEAQEKPSLTDRKDYVTTADLAAQRHYVDGLRSACCIDPQLLQHPTGSKKSCSLSMLAGLLRSGLGRNSANCHPTTVRFLVSPRQAARKVRKCEESISEMLGTVGKIAQVRLSHYGSIEILLALDMCDSGRKHHLSTDMVTVPLKLKAIVDSLK